LRIVELLCRQFAKLRLPREALSLAWYFDATSPLAASLLEHVPEVDRARTYELWARKRPSDARTLERQAAAELERAGLLVRAAICYERAGDMSEAGALWSRLAQMLDSRSGDDYAAGLARYNVARISRALGNAAAAREAAIGAVHRLEEAADRFESIGQRERAFDCYHVLIAIGELSGVFEHVLEGSVNAIRILREDNLRYHALRLYERAQEYAERADEFAAAATLAREMTDYARKHGLARVASQGTLRQASLWQRAADSNLARNGPAELAENALVASLLAYAELGQYRDVGRLYQRLQELDLDAARKEHYARATRRYESTQNAVLELGGLHDELGEHAQPPDVWLVDLIEWEENGSAAEACADVVLDPEEEADPITRRTALVGRLVALAAERAPAQQQAHALRVLCKFLAPIKLYALLSPLERLCASPDRSVRRAAVHALSRYFYKRSFITLEQALRDPDPEVATEAVGALGRLKFPHAFDPLARIYRTAHDSRARLAALAAIAQIDLEDAADLLLDALEHGQKEEREKAIAALQSSRIGSHFVQAARSVYAQGSPRLKQAINEVFRGHKIQL
jgi:HEAT repeat protein